MPNPDGTRIVVPVQAGTTDMQTGPEGGDLAMDSDDSRELKYNQSGTIRTVVNTAGTQTLTNKTLTSPVIGGDLGVNDDVSIELGTDDDSVIRHRTAVLAADTALTDVLEGTPVTEALAANSLIISNITNDGDILVAASDGGTSNEFVKVDASEGILYHSGYTGGIGLELARDYPARDLAGAAVHIWGGSAGTVTAAKGSRLIVEASDTTANYISLLS